MNKIRSATFNLFDVTLRHSLQSSRKIIPTNIKISLLNTIVKDFKPKNIEVGSLASPKIFPQLADSDKVFTHALDLITKSNKYSFTPYLLVPPNICKLEQAISLGCDSISIPSSVSEEFQLKNIGMSLDETHTFIIKTACKMPFNNIKVYLSCINLCPINGEFISAKQVAYQVLRYVFYKEVTQICLADTYGTLTDNDLIEIMTILKRKLVHPSKIGLHIHSGPAFTDQQRVSKLLGVAKLAGIKSIDVSISSEGGCIVAMNKCAIYLRSNLRYSDIESSMSYLEKYYAHIIEARSSLPFNQSS